MRKLVLSENDFYFSEIIDGFRVKHKATQIEIMEFGKFAKQTAWAGIQKKLSEHYGQTIIIKRLPI